MHHADPDLLEAIRTVIRLARIAQQGCEEGGLTLAQFRALNSAANGGQRAYELAQATAVSRPAVSALTNGMVKAGLLHRGDSASDGRGVVFSVTDHGLETLHEVEEILVRRFREVLGDSAGHLAVLYSDELETALDAQADRDFGTNRMQLRQRS